MESGQGAGQGVAGWFEINTQETIAAMLWVLWAQLPNDPMIRREPLK